MHASKAPKLNFDSLDAVEYAMEIEDAFDVHIEDEKAARVRTVQDALDLLRSVLRA
jgi:acyl carrier protein